MGSPHIVVCSRGTASLAGTETQRTPDRHEEEATMEAAAVGTGVELSFAAVNSAAAVDDSAPPSATAGMAPSPAEERGLEAEWGQEGEAARVAPLAQAAGEAAEEMMTRPGARAEQHAEQSAVDEAAGACVGTPAAAGLKDRGGTPRRRVRAGDMGEEVAQSGNTGAGAAAEGAAQPSEKSPAELAEDESIWQLASAWDVTPLQRMDQPFLVRRMPPKILENYTLCLLAPLLRLAKNPDCLGAWTVLQFLPRLTLRPLLEPVEGNRWIKIETRLHHFRLGDLADLYSEACAVPVTEAPSRHQPDDAGLCARAEGLIKKANISKAVAALQVTLLVEATPTTLAAL
ncbi:unnamed protein product [Closterium sp. Naga37s-1]|nr:unnamed protein product [Closterium sp. Naga37s-1]